MIEIIRGVYFEYFNRQDVNDGKDLTQSQAEDVARAGIEKRRRERTLEYYILNQLFAGHNPLIVHLDSGAPFLLLDGERSALNISISHCGAGVAIAVSETISGVDVEQSTPKLQRVADRYLSADELKYFEEITDGLLVGWTLKEAAYKAAMQPGLALVEGIKITPCVSGDRYRLRVAGREMCGKVYTIADGLMLSVVTP